MTNEEWRDIPQFEGYYQASSQGRIRSIERMVQKSGHLQKLQGVIIKPQRGTNGYLAVSLSKNGTVRQERVHRIIARTFIPNPDKLPEVNHINEDKTDNRVNNLEWVTIRVNRLYGTRLERTVKHRNQSGTKNGMYGRKGALNPRAKAIQQFTLNDSFVQEFSCIKEAAKTTGSNAALISRAAKGLLRQTNGFKWKYKQ